MRLSSFDWVMLVIFEATSAVTSLMNVRSVGFGLVSVVLFVIFGIKWLIVLSGLYISLLLGFVRVCLVFLLYCAVSCFSFAMLFIISSLSVRFGFGMNVKPLHRMLL